MFTPDFNLLSCELDNFTLKFYIESFYIDIILKQNKIVEVIHNTLTVPCEKSKMVSFDSLIMKNIAAPAAQSWFPLKLIYFIDFVSASSCCCLI